MMGVSFPKGETRVLSETRLSMMMIEWSSDFINLFFSSF